MPLEGLRMPFCASRGFSSPSARLGPAGGVEGPLVARSVHTSSLLSPMFIRGLGIRELLSCGGLLLLFMSCLALPPYLCTFDEVMGWESRRGSFFFFFFWLCSRLSLPPYLCTLSEVVRWVRLLRAAPVRFPPRPPDLRLEGQGGYLSLPLVQWFSLVVLLLALSLRLPLPG